MVKNLLFLFIIALICGCSPSKKILISDSLDQIPLVTGSVVNPSAFQKGGTLVLKSFKPGTGAEADDDTDLLSWMMIKGIKDSLPNEHTHFTIQTEDQEDLDFNLDGHIEDYGREGHLPDLKLRKNEVYFSIDGSIWLRETGEKIFLFQASTVINLKTQVPKTVAYETGVAIAHFIGSHSN